jgi:hypothetical protein
VRPLARCVRRSSVSATGVRPTLSVGDRVRPTLSVGDRVRPTLSVGNRGAVDVSVGDRGAAAREAFMHRDNAAMIPGAAAHSTSRYRSAEPINTNKRRLYVGSTRDPPE